MSDSDESYLLKIFDIKKYKDIINLYFFYFFLIAPDYIGKGIVYKILYIKVKN